VALDRSALLEVPDALTAAEVDDRIRQAAQTIYQALIEAGLTAVIGAAPHERADTRLAQRNGHRPRMLTTSAEDLELRMPKLRAGSFFPSLLERRRRVDQALFAVVMEAYLHGGQHPQGRRPGQSLGGRQRHQQERGLRDLL
jgi:putative transposase